VSQLDDPRKTATAASHIHPLLCFCVVLCVQRHHVGPAWVKEAYKRVRKHKSAAGAGMAGTALARSSSRSSTRSGSSTPTTDDEMQLSVLNNSALEAATTSASLFGPSLQPLPLPLPLSLPQLQPLPVQSSSASSSSLMAAAAASAGATPTAAFGSTKPLVKMSAYNLVKSLGGKAPLSAALDRPKLCVHGHDDRS